MLLILSSFCVQKGLMSTFCFSAFPTFCNDAVNRNIPNSI